MLSRKGTHFCEDLEELDLEKGQLSEPREVSEREQPARAWEEGAPWVSERKVAIKVMGMESATGGGQVQCGVWWVASQKQSVGQERL